MCWKYAADLREVSLLTFNSQLTMDLGPISGGYNGIQFCISFSLPSDSCILETCNTLLLDLLFQLILLLLLILFQFILLVLLVLLRFPLLLQKPSTKHHGALPGTPDRSIPPDGHGHLRRLQALPTAKNRSSVAVRLRYYRRNPNRRCHQRHSLSRQSKGTGRDLDSRHSPRSLVA